MIRPKKATHSLKHQTTSSSINSSINRISFQVFQTPTVVVGTAFLVLVIIKNIRSAVPPSMADFDVELGSVPKLSSSLSSKSSYPPPPIKVAYAISLIECTDNHKSGQSSIAGLVDASLVLRHSVHQNSVRNPRSGSKYDYQMYAIVHEQAKKCAHYLESAGFTTLIKPPPIIEADIKGELLRKKIKRELCCGVHEFVKLYAYTLPHPVVVHLDIDFIFQKPMDAVIDVMLGSSDNATRALVEREDLTDPWPNKVEVMWTRDYHSSYGKGRKSGFQAGFWILTPSQEHFNSLLEIIREGNYVDGFSRENGWAGLGYGGFIGAMAMQGLMAYYYDVHVPGTWVELNNCRFNAITAIVTKQGACKSGRSSCEDCRTTPLDKIYSFHYTACRKPWQCIAKKSDDPQNKNSRKYSIPMDIVDYDHCMHSQAVWHGFRTDLENQLYQLTGDPSIKSGQNGTYFKKFFYGHCSEDQSAGYLRLGGSPETLKRIPELYDSAKYRTKHTMAPMVLNESFEIKGLRWISRK